VILQLPAALTEFAQDILLTYQFNGGSNETPCTYLTPHQRQQPGPLNQTMFVSIKVPNSWTSIRAQGYTGSFLGPKG
jgi:hypothetical protein